MGNIFTDIWEMEDLRKRVLFTLGMLGVYRMGIFVPAPGIDRVALGKFLHTQEQGSMFGLYDMFTGGALEQYSVFVLGIMPYISASIMMQLLTVMVPSLERVQKEGQQGRNKIVQYTRYLTLLIAGVQGFLMATGLEQMRINNDSIVIGGGGLGFRIMTMLTVMAGSCFIMWLGEQISDRGIGNGSSIIITSGIMARVPASVANFYTLVVEFEQINLLQATLLILLGFAVVTAIVFVERGQRRIPIQYAKRVVGRQAYAGQNTHLPLKLNTSGVVPPIFASSLLTFPATISTFTSNTLLDWLSAAFHPGRWLFNLAFFALILFFSFFYTAVTFNPVDVAENLKKQGGYIPRIRPGNETAEYLDRLLTRLTVAGATYLSAVCILPSLMESQFHVPIAYGGTGLIILCGVTLDTVAQIEAHLMTKHYDGVIGPKGTRVRNRRGLLTGGRGPAV
jgi:preprotein translocase subunit SecY